MPSMQLKTIRYTRKQEKMTTTDSEGLQVLELSDMDFKLMLSMFKEMKAKLKNLSNDPEIIKCDTAEFPTRKSGIELGDIFSDKVQLATVGLAAKNC